MEKKKGRPSGLTQERVKQAEKLCRLGATDAEVADFFEVSRMTIWRWKEDNAAFCDALKAGKEPADDRVERSLFSRAVGYECDDVDIRVINNEVIQTPIRKHYPPDPTSCIFWLKNRKPDQWREKREDQDKLTPEEAAKAAQEAIAAAMATDASA